MERQNFRHISHQNGFKFSVVLSRMDGIHLAPPVTQSLRLAMRKGLVSSVTAVTVRSKGVTCCSRVADVGEVEPPTGQLVQDPSLNSPE